MSNGKASSKVNIVIRSIVLFLIPIFWASIYCLISGKTVLDVSILNSEWNDELFYYKLTDNILHFGYPRGYFGFNESHAELLSFAAWSPVLLIQWLLFGGTFGWGYLSPILSNLFFLGLALMAFGFFAKPSKRQIISLFILLGAYVPFARFSLSCLPEAEIISFAILYFGIAVYSFGKKEEKGFFLGSSVFFLHFLAALLTLMRPYLITLFLLPFYESFSMKRGKHPVVRAFAIGAISFVITIGIYFAISKFFSAPYLIDLFYTDWISAFKDGIASGISYFFNKMYQSFMMVKGLISSCAGHKTFYASGIYYLIFLVLLVVALGESIFCILKRKSEPKFARNALLWIQLTFSMIVFFVADMEMYRIQEGGRHTFVFSVAAILLLSTLSISEDKKIEAARDSFQALLAIGIFLLFVLWGDIPYEFSVPYDTKEAQSENLELAKSLSEKMELFDSKNPCYENTIIWDYGTDYKSFQCFYAVPNGFGINMCVEEYIEANIDNLKSRYIGTVHDSVVDKICKEKGYEELAYGDRISVYKRY